jgi:signal transduction histidine kinase
LASVGFLAAGVAHEINNPLGIIAGYAELLLKRTSRMAESADRAQLEEFLTIVRDEVFRCKHVTQKLLSLSRSKPESRSRLNVAKAAGEVVRLVRGVEKFADRAIEVEATDNGRAEVIGSDQEIRQLLLNLVVNALEATEPGRGRVTIHVTTGGDDCRIEVTDNGCGMSAETLDRVFEPFYTERAGGDEAGTGLGLSVSHAIITAHGGRIWAESAGPGSGSTFIVTLPLASEVAV